MNLSKIVLLSLGLVVGIYAAEAKDAQINASYENIKTSSFIGPTEAYALKNAFNNVLCPRTNIKLIGSAVCSEATSSTESQLWECVVIYSCTND